MNLLNGYQNVTLLCITLLLSLSKNLTLSQLVESRSSLLVNQSIIDNNNETSRENSLRLSLVSKTPPSIKSQNDTQILTQTLYPSQSPTQQKPDLATKFVLLTTGDQIKLYPFLSSANQDDDKFSDDRISNDFHYIIKPSQINLIDQIKLNYPIDYHDNSTYINWLMEKSKKISLDKQKIEGSLDNSTTRASILPSDAKIEEQTYEDISYNDKSGWKRPWITDVDYFFDNAFCQSEDSNSINRNLDEELSDSESTLDFIVSQTSCLVIVWLDTTNHFVHYGSVDLIKNPIYQGPHPQQMNGSLSASPLDRGRRHSQKSAQLIVEEFIPIDIYKNLALLSDQPLIKTEEMIRKTFAITLDHRYNVLHVAFSDGYSNQANRILSGRLKHQLDLSSGTQMTGETLHSFNDCPNLANSQQELINLAVDEEYGDWLVYYDKTGSNIYGLKLVNKNFLYTTESNGFAQATQALIMNIPSPGNTHNQHQDFNNKQLSKRKQFLEDQSPIQLIEKQSTGFAFNQKDGRIYWITSIGQIFSCDRIGQNINFVGSLSSKPMVRTPHSLQVFGESLFIVDRFKWALVGFNLNQQRKDHDTRNNRPTHKVFLVERYGLYNLRFVDLDGDQLFKHPRYDDQLDIYDRLLDKQSSSSPICKQDRGIDEVSSYSDDYKYYMLELLILYIVFIIWLSLPWVKRKLKK